MSERGRYSVVRSDSTPAKAAEDAADAREFSKDVRVSYRGARVTVPVALVAGLLGSVGTWFTTRGAPVDCASKGDVNALDLKVSRQGDDIRALTATVNANADREQNHFAIINGALISIRQK